MAQPPEISGIVLNPEKSVLLFVNVRSICIKVMEPKYDGQCAFAMSIGKKGVAGDEKYRLEEDGKVYLFFNWFAKFLFNLLPNTKIKAEENWQS